MTAEKWQSLERCTVPVLDSNFEFTQEWKDKWIPYASSLGAEFGWDKCPNQLPKPKKNMARPSSRGFSDTEQTRRQWNGILYIVLDKVPGGKLEMRALYYVCIVLCPKLLLGSQKEGDTPEGLVSRINGSARHSVCTHNEFVQEGELWKIATILEKEKKARRRKERKESGLAPNTLRGRQISQIAESDSEAGPSIAFKQPPTKSSKRKRKDAGGVVNNHDASPKRKVLKTKTLPKAASDESQSPTSNPEASSSIASQQPNDGSAPNSSTLLSRPQTLPETSDKSQSPTSGSAAGTSSASQQPHKGPASNRPTLANGRHPLPGSPQYEKLLQAEPPSELSAEEEAAGASSLEVAPLEPQDHGDGDPDLGTQRPRNRTPEEIEAIEGLVHLAQTHDEAGPVPSAPPRRMLTIEEMAGNHEVLSMGGNWREPAVYNPIRTPSIQEERANRNGFRPNPLQQYHGEVRKKRNPNQRMPYGFAFDLPSLKVQVNPLLGLPLEVQSALGMYQIRKNVREKKYANWYPPRSQSLNQQARIEANP